MGRTTAIPVKRLVMSPIPRGISAKQYPSARTDCLEARPSYEDVLPYRPFWSGDQMPAEPRYEHAVSCPKTTYIQYKTSRVFPPNT